EIVGCLPTLKCKSLRTVSAQSETPTSVKTVAIGAAAHLPENIVVSPLLLFFVVLVYSQTIHHLFLLVSINQQLLRIDVVGVVLYCFLGVANKRVGLCQIVAVSGYLRR